MQVRRALPSGLAELARLQDGVLTREQALAYGLSRAKIDRAVQDGSWQRLARGVIFAAPIEVPWSALAWAGVLIGGDQARIGGRAAAHLHRLLNPAPSEITVLVPASGAVPRPRQPWSFHRERPGARLARTLGSPPRISVEDVVLDLAADPDPEVAVHWVTAAVQGWLTTPERLRRAMSARRFVPQRKVLEQVLPDVGAGVHSTLELSYLRDVERAHGLPTGTRQFRRAGTSADVLYELYALLVELDGRLGHEREGLFRDMMRDNVATADGLATLRYGHRDVHGRPCEVAMQVGGVLMSRGWAGPLTRCARCRRVA